MSRRLIKFLLIAAALAVMPLLSACGNDEQQLDVVEGEALDLGELSYNVQITRFLNRSSPEDAEYLAGLPDAPSGQGYLAVFMRIENDSDQPQSIPTAIKIRDTRDNVFVPVQTKNPFALQLGAQIPADGTIPGFDTPAASGPIKGAMVLFAVNIAAIEDRPFKLEIPGPGSEIGMVELDL